MKVVEFINILNTLGGDFYTGVPDSLLEPLCSYLYKVYGISKKHIIAANEGNCVGLAAGYHLATGKNPVIYLQNSGIGNTMNPITSLLNNKVYSIPSIFVIGWRGEPGVKDEPQHIFQGEITLQSLELMGIQVIIIDKKTTSDEINKSIINLKNILETGKSVAFLIRKNALETDKKIVYKNNNNMIREEIMRQIVAFTEEDLIISTTGKVSRELFEIREQNHQEHKYDFLTVGSMGHSSSIALGIALHRPEKKVWCIDGDGAMLMHMGAIAIIGSNAPKNMVHIVINNSAHDTVGGMPTVANSVNFVQIALGCGYPKAVSISNYEELDQTLKEAKEIEQLMFIEIKAGLGSREDLGRPTTSAIENKVDFMRYLREE